ncbi:coiled-coil domain-containing protein 24 [Emydura macquarii macquarii]|uniref:coiled-coil domain-containing protein 24 n=1 Tax=Emydura macquarii macquarii TaxID=1129001 RepID=UPI00352B2677
MSRSPRGRGGPGEPLPSLWGLVAARVAPSEVPAVRSVLGAEAVERSVELHAEVATLLELWQEARSARPGPDRCPVPTLLAAPPHRKELVRRELRLLLRSLQQQASQEGRDTAGAIAKYSPHVVRFALGPPAGGECGGRDGSLSGTGTSTSPGPGLALQLEPLKDMLNVSRIHQAQARLRALLEEECRLLERHVGHLQRCLEEEHQAAAGPVQPVQEPTMAELQEQKQTMERDLQLGQAALGPSPSQEFRAPGAVAPQQPSCPVGTASPAPAAGPASGPPRLAPVAPSPAGRGEAAPSTALGRRPPGGCSRSLGGLAGGIRGEAAHPGQGRTDSGAEHQDLAAPTLRGAGVPPASPAGTRLAPRSAAAGSGLPLLPCPPPTHRLPLRPFSCRRLRLLGCQGPG